MKTKIISPLIFLCLLSMILIILNFDKLSYITNSKAYYKTTAIITEVKKDPLLGIFPKISITYNYKDHTYIEDKYAIYLYIFNYEPKLNDKLSIYINTKAPNYSIFDLKYHHSIINLIISVMMAFNIWILIQRIQLKRRRKIRK